jgi:hypothetical protein
MLTNLQILVIAIVVERIQILDLLPPLLDNLKAEAGQNQIIIAIPDQATALALLTIMVEIIVTLSHQILVAQPLQELIQAQAPVFLEAQIEAQVVITQVAVHREAQTDLQVALILAEALLAAQDHQVVALLVAALLVAALRADQEAQVEVLQVVVLQVVEDNF